MSTGSASEVFALLRDRKIPPAQVAEAQDRPAPTSAQDGLDTLDNMRWWCFPATK